VTGIVHSVKYLYQTSGRDSHTNRQTMYVEVELHPSKMGDTWE